MLLLKGALVVSTLWQDIIRAMIISNYCLQAHLLACYVRFLRAELIQRPVDTTRWMRDVEEFKKMLCFFNKKMGPSVVILTFANFCCATSAALWLMDVDRLDPAYLIDTAAVVNTFLWIFIAIAPFVQVYHFCHAPACF